ncbi:MAG: YIP1 family protein [Euryarchaeota archaeon]|nr:YIP1 family protein [Euryarchaeota archaeon]
MSEFRDEFIGTWKKVITTPGDFFKEMPTSGGYEAPLKFAVVNYIIAGIGTALVTILAFTFLAPLLPMTSFSFGSAFSFGGALSNIIVTPIIGIIGLFISGAILYICFKIVGGSGSYEGTVRILSYTSAVNAVSWIPILGWIVALYAIYLGIVGGTFVHNITTLRSVIAILIPAVVAVVLTIIAVLLIVVAALGAGGF